MGQEATTLGVPGKTPNNAPEKRSPLWLDVMLTRSFATPCQNFVTLNMANANKPGRLTLSGYLRFATDARKTLGREWYLSVAGVWR